MSNPSKKKVVNRNQNKMAIYFLLSHQVICYCLIFFVIECIPFGNTLPLVSTNGNKTNLINTRRVSNKQLKSHSSLHITETANFHIQPTKVKQITETDFTNLIAASTEPFSQSVAKHQNQHYYQKFQTQSLKGSEDYQRQQKTKFHIEPTPSQRQQMQTISPYFDGLNSITPSFPPVITSTQNILRFPKLSSSLSIETIQDKIWSGTTSTTPKNSKIINATNIPNKENLSTLVPQIHTDKTISFPKQSSTTTATTRFAVVDDYSTFYETNQEKTTSKTSNSEHLNLETLLKPMVGHSANTTDQSPKFNTNGLTEISEFHFDQDMNALFNETMTNRIIISTYIQPTPSTNHFMMIPQLKTKYSLFNNPKHSTQRPTRNILPLDIRVHNQWRNSKSSTLAPSGLLHLTEDDPPTSYVHKTGTSNKKGFTSMPRNTNNRVLAAVTTEFMKSSEMIPDLFVAAAKTPNTKSRLTQTLYEGPLSGGGVGAGSTIMTTSRSGTAALSFQSKEDGPILTATATLNPSHTTHAICNTPCSEPGCKCCQDKQLGPTIATTAVTGQPPSSATPNIEVSTNKSATESISLSAKFGIGMGCLIAVWLVVGPVVCLICRIRDKVKESEGSEVDEIEKKRKKKTTTNPKDRRTSTSSKVGSGHPLTESIVMNELNKQLSKKKNSREKNEYLLLAKDKAELECLSRSDISKTITKKPMSTFDQTRTLTHCLNKWDMSDIEDSEEEEEEEEEKDRLTPILNTPTVSV